MTITLEAHGKINWALDITGRRTDGYHTLDMLMQRIELCDTLTLTGDDALSLYVNGLPDPEPEKNLVIRAARALQAATGVQTGARIDLTKRIPSRAGLGGGSADCAAALQGLNIVWGLFLSDQELSEIGLTLGADVPYCLSGRFARVRGIGEIIDPIDKAPSVPLVMITPGGGLSTAEVYRTYDKLGEPARQTDMPLLIDAVCRKDLPAVNLLHYNALWAPAVSLMPELTDYKTAFYGLGAKAAFMTGSGSTIVAAFESDAGAQAAAAKMPGAMLTHTI